MLNRLQYSSPYMVSSFSSECFEISPGPVVTDTDKMNIRVRCKGSVRKYSVEKACVHFYMYVQLTLLVVKHCIILCHLEFSFL